MIYRYIKVKKIKAYKIGSQFRIDYQEFDNFLNKVKKQNNMTKEIKAVLLNVLSCDIIINKKQRPLMVGLSETTASLVKCFEGEERKIKFPELI